ncbi:heat-inducible protein [Fusobacterium necrogenes]|uniref:Heat-inducible protein n=1 Tax=Fusobacterium necrogenes TaxID=858 RepID=A0A377GX67_9FUSO|nr:META domain-containing protein [Fusobacterium necrogenes]STO31526.1 heat-inducible protein [Fusobacterium necrogenes]
MKKIILSITILISLIGCTNLEKKEESLPQTINSVVELINVEYNLVNIFPDQGLTLGFDENGRIFGYSGLNRFFGRAEIINGSIKIVSLSSTRMGGSREDLIREDQYLTLLKSMTKIQKENENLVLSNEKEEQLIFSVK